MSLFLSIFREIRDPRDVNARHDLAELLSLALAATVCGAKSSVEIAARRGGGRRPRARVGMKRNFEILTNS
jgi:hypothetical protein